MKTSNFYTKLSGYLLGGFLCMGIQLAQAAVAVQGIEIDGDILLNDGGSHDWASDQADPNALGCLVDEDALSLTDCIGEGALLIMDENAQGGATDPDIHGGGEKLSTPEEWTFITGSPPAKNDLGNLYAHKKVATEAVPEADVIGDTYFYGAWERFVNNGDSYVDFEFNAKFVSCEDTDMSGDFDATECAACSDTSGDGTLDALECPFPTPGNDAGLPGRSSGDFVLSYKLGTANGKNGLLSDVQLILLGVDGSGNLDFDNPLLEVVIDTDSDLSALDGGLDVSNKINGLCLSDPCPPQTLVIALNNDTIDSGPWGTEQKNDNKIGDFMIDNGNFTEVALNLDAVGKGPSCPGTAFVNVKSKASSSETAQLKDTDRPRAFDLTNCGQITVVKETDPDGGTGFDFDLTPDPQNVGTVTLDDNDATGSNPSSYTFTLLEPSTYNLDEVIPTSWELDSISCVDDAGAPASDLSDPGSTTLGDIDIGLVANGAVTCTYTNVQSELKVAKAVVNACKADTGKFDLFIGTTEFEDVVDGETKGPEVIPLNQFVSVSETTGNTSSVQLSAYDSSVDCTNVGSETSTQNDTGTSIDVKLSGGGVEETCTFTNVRLPTVQIVKRTLSDDPDVSFDLYIYDGVAKAAIDNNTTIDDETDDVKNGMSSRVIINTEIGTSNTFGPIVLTETLDNAAGLGLAALETLDDPISGYRTLWACDNGASGNGRVIAIASLRSGEDLTCTFSNVEDAQGISCPIIDTPAP